MSRFLAALLALILASFALSACGDDEGDEPETTTPAVEATEPEPEPEPTEAEEEAKPEAGPVAATGPVDPLRTDGIGPLDFGTPKREVREAFGAPDEKQEVNFGTGKAPRVDWLYNDVPGVRIVFDTARNELAGYSCESDCALETEDGFGIGDRLADVKAQYGDQLEEYAIGTGGVILLSGADQSAGGLVFTGNAKGKGKLISLAAFDTIAGPAGD